MAGCVALTEPIITDSCFLFFDLRTLELAIFDLKIGFSVNCPPRGLILRSQFWNLGPRIQKNKKCRKASEVI